MDYLDKPSLDPSQSPNPSNTCPHFFCLTTGVQSKWYFAPLDDLVLDHPSPPCAARLEEIEPEEYYATVGNDGRALRVPADLDD
jgi:hypothetical protein